MRGWPGTDPKPPSKGDVEEQACEDQHGAEDVEGHAEVVDAEGIDDNEPTGNADDIRVVVHIVEGADVVDLEAEVEGEVALGVEHIACRYRSRAGVSEKGEVEELMASVASKGYVAALGYVRLVPALGAGSAVPEATVAALGSVTQGVASARLSVIRE